MKSRDFLSEIVAYKREYLRKKKNFFDVIRDKTTETRMSERYHVFREAITQPGKVNLIAEIKRASPSQGVIRESFSVRGLAEIYARHGAAAISVLTEDRYFQGRPQYLKEVSEYVPLPALTKDFILGAAQIYEAFHYGASAILLIMAILTDRECKELLNLARQLDMDCLVEVHNREELDRALACGAEIIGINHRDLHTFVIDMSVSEALRPYIPHDKVVVAESGIKTHADVKRLQGLGVHAVLIGETFLRAEDVGAKITEIMQGDQPE